VALKCALQLIIGVGLVTLFSDPMVDALTDLTDKSHKVQHFNQTETGSPYTILDYGSYIPIGSKSIFYVHYIYFCSSAFYISFVVTPLCSNASELVSSLIFASKKMKVNSSMTYSQVSMKQMHALRACCCCHQNIII